MQLDSVTELLGIANYKVAYMVRNSKERTDLVLRRIEETPCVCSGCGKVHHTLFTAPILSSLRICL